MELDKQQEMDVVSVLSTVGGVNRAEVQTVELTELDWYGPLLGRFIRRPGQNEKNKSVNC